VARPRSASTEQAILLAVLELLPQVGYDRLSLDLVAERAGSSKATIYRHWTAGKADLVRDAIALRLPATPTPAQPTGSLRGDLVALMGQVRASARDAYVLVVGLSPLVEVHEEVVGAVRERTAAAARANASVVLDRDPGVSHVGVDQRAWFAALLDALVWDRMFTPHAVLDDAFLEQAVDLVLLPLLQAWSQQYASISGGGTG
jgi:AcrR family transcriptional regulator